MSARSTKSAKTTKKTSSSTKTMIQTKKKSVATSVRPKTNSTTSKTVAPHQIQPRRFFVGQCYTTSLNLIGSQLGPIFASSAIFVILSIGLNYLNEQYFHQNFIFGLVILAILLILGIFMSIYYHQLLTKQSKKPQAAFKQWRRLVNTILTNIVVFFLTLLSYIPFLLLGAVAFLFAFSKIQISQVINPLLTFDLIGALQAFTNQISPGWIITSAVLLILGLIVAVYVFLNYSLAGVATISEGQARVGSALTVSKRLATGNKWRLLALILLNALFNIIGTLFFGVGLLFTLPLTSIATLAAYQQAKGQQKINF